MRCESTTRKRLKKLRIGPRPERPDQGRGLPQRQRKAQEIAPSKHGKRAKFTKKVKTRRSEFPARGRAINWEICQPKVSAMCPPPKKLWGIYQLDPYIQVQHEQIR